MVGRKYVIGDRWRTARISRVSRVERTISSPAWCLSRARALSLSFSFSDVSCPRAYAVALRCVALRCVASRRVACVGPCTGSKLAPSCVVSCRVVSRWPVSSALATVALGKPAHTYRQRRATIRRVAAPAPAPAPVSTPAAAAAARQFASSPLRLLASSPPRLLASPQRERGKP